MSSSWPPPDHAAPTRGACDARLVALWPSSSCHRWRRGPQHPASTSRSVPCACGKPTCSSAPTSPGEPFTSTASGSPERSAHSFTPPSTAPDTRRRPPPSTHRHVMADRPCAFALSLIHISEPTRRS
eukprot:5725194-Prymnesium_polylepis.2